MTNSKGVVWQVQNFGFVKSVIFGQYFVRFNCSSSELGDVKSTFFYDEGTHEIHLQWLSALVLQRCLFCFPRDTARMIVTTLTKLFSVLLCCQSKVWWRCSPGCVDDVVCVWLCMCMMIGGCCVCVQGTPRQRVGDKCTGDQLPRKCWNRASKVLMEKYKNKNRYV